MKKVSVGTVAARNKTWFPELSDKSKSNTCRYYVIMYMCFYKYFACTYVTRSGKRYPSAQTFFLSFIYHANVRGTLYAMTQAVLK